MSNNVFALAARAEQAALHMERARLTIEARRAEVELAKAAVEAARVLETEARAALDAVMADAETAGLNRRAFKQAADDRLQSLIGSGLLQVTPFGDDADSPVDPAPLTARGKPARVKPARAEAPAPAPTPPPEEPPAAPDETPPPSDSVVILHADADATLAEAAMRPAMTDPGEGGDEGGEEPDVDPDAREEYDGTDGHGHANGAEPVPPLPPAPPTAPVIPSAPPVADTSPAASAAPAPAPRSPAAVPSFLRGRGAAVPGFAKPPGT